MTLRHLNIYIMVYETLNITKAAQSLHMTQPAVTRAIHETENYYNVRLFERLNRRLSPTDAGDRLYARALHISSAFSGLEKEMTDGGRTTLKVGASITIGTYMLPEILASFKKSHPDTAVKTMIMNSAALQNELCENKLDIALIENTPDNINLRAEIFGKDSMVLIVPPGHPFAQKKEVLPAELQEEDMFMREEGSAGRSFLDHVFAANSVVPKTAGISISTAAIVNEVAQGLGISILPQKLAQDGIESGKVKEVPVKGLNLERNFYIVMHKNKYVSAVMKDFLSELKNGSFY